MPNAWLRSLGEVYCLMMIWIKPSIGELQIHVAVSLHDTTGSEESGDVFLDGLMSTKQNSAQWVNLVNPVVKWTYGYCYLK